MYDKYFDPSHGTAILYICGEWTCIIHITYIGNSCSGYTLTLAQRYRGIVFAVEHRFFGQSQPVDKNENTYSTENMEKYLSVN